MGVNSSNVLRDKVPSLNDKDLIGRFTEAVYFPLLEQLPKEWVVDFERVELTFTPSENICMAYAAEGSFSINIDLDKMESVTRGQLDKPPKMQHLIAQYFGNLAFAVVRAFYRYNKAQHPETVEGKDVKKITVEFMDNIFQKGKKKLNDINRYIV